MILKNNEGEEITADQFMHELERKTYRMKSKVNPEGIMAARKEPEEEKLKPIGFVASKNKDFSVKKIYPVSTFYYKEAHLLIICLIDKEIKIYNLD